MARIRIRKSWELPENQVTPEDQYLGRREFLKQAAWAGWITASALWFPRLTGVPPAAAGDPPASRTAMGSGPSPEITPASIASRYNNFYEFGTVKDQIWKQARRLDPRGWTVEVGGLVKRPRVLEIDALIARVPSEERIYRLRCVEAWSVVVPWTGFPLRRLIDQLEPLPSARYVKFTTFLRPHIAPGQKHRFWEPWPYTEGLTLEEARNELSFLATGVYGHRLPPQHGAPIRLVVPWKYGFKSIKSIVRMDFTREEPDTFWQTLSPLEYDFSANVDPHRPYARWHQEFERLPGKEDPVPTKLYNGYAEQVASLYRS